MYFCTMSKFIYLLTLNFCVFTLMAQTNLTPVDAQGKNHGVWKKYHDNGKLRYEGKFKHGTEIDTFNFYYYNGGLRAVNVFSSDTAGLCYSKQYSDGRLLVAEGKYLKTKRKGTWLFYDASSRLLSEEQYVDDKKHGKAIVYHENGKIAETSIYKNGIKEGAWELFYDSGNIKMRGAYENDHLQGVTYLFEYDGSLRAKGNYNKGLMAGSWKFYNEKKELEYQEEWRHGRMISTTQPNQSEESPSPIQSVDEMRKEYER